MNARAASSRLSKSRFVTGLQCHKQLWWQVHEPDAPELKPDLLQQALFDQGHVVGAVARSYVPGGRLVDVPHRAFAERLAATAAALRDGVPAVYEAAFAAGGVFAAVDILVREGDRFRIVEVKSSTSVKEEHIPDAGIQAHVLRQSGLDVAGVEVMHLNRACAHPDLSNLFAREDVTQPVEALLPELPGQVEAQLEMLCGPLPQVPIGEHCTKPRDCPFLARCWPVLPEHHVSTLFRIGQRAAALEEQGYATIHDLPASLPLNAAAARQRRAVQEGRIVVEPGLGRALRAFAPPLALLDFETVGPAIPVWEGCHPYDQVPAQFSCHVLDAGGRVTHHAWVAEGSGDPRPEMARRVVEACRPARAVAAYYADFERRCLETLKRGAPDLERELADVQNRLVDLHPVVRDLVYHPQFHGSFSLKSVLPALVPELGYDDLEIAEGDLASLYLSWLLLEPAKVPPGQGEKLRAALLAYCERDTWAMVKLLERLRELAAS
jgi:predicted RecB family nuclease